MTRNPETGCGLERELTELKEASKGAGSISINAHFAGGLRRALCRTRNRNGHFRRSVRLRARRSGEVCLKSELAVRSRSQHRFEPPTGTIPAPYPLHILSISAPCSYEAGIQRPRRGQAEDMPLGMETIPSLHDSIETLIQSSPLLGTKNTKGMYSVNPQSARGLAHSKT